MTNLIKHAQEVIAKYPQLNEDIQGLIDLCVMEIEDGASSDNEIELCWSDIDKLVEDIDKKPADIPGFEGTMEALNNITIFK